jgi:hypothetical protein
MNEHDFATTIEMMVAQKLGVRWSDYEKTVLALSPKPRKLTVKPLSRNGLRTLGLR